MSDHDAERAGPGAGALMVVGTASGAGKSTLVTALCRAFARRGPRVAPFKAQNMTTYTVRTSDGGLLGVAQALQARAAGVQPEARMGPVLLRPTGPRASDVVVLGRVLGESDAVGYADRADRLRPVVLDALVGLRSVHDVVVLEGAGGAAEINLLDRDLVNLPLAAAAGVPAVLVVDIERGGAFASAYGTWALLPPHLRACLRGFVINSFRGDVRLLADGLADLSERTGVPVLGVLPHLGDHVMLGVEDPLDLDRRAVAGTAAAGDPVRVAVLRLPQLTNLADVEPLLLEPSVRLAWATSPAELADADLVVVPASASAQADARWLADRGLDAAVAKAPHTVRVGRLDVGPPEAVRVDRLDVSPSQAARVDLTDDDARRALLAQVATARGRDFVPGATAYRQALEAHVDHLADWVEAHLDVGALLTLARSAVPPGQGPGWSDGSGPAIVGF